MELMQGASLLSRPAEEFANDELVEEMWAMKAMEHAHVHFNLLTSVDPRYLRLTPFDDYIYKTFRQYFPDLRVDVVTDETLKSPEAKLRWRIFAKHFDKLEDYSYGTLMRSDASIDFTADNALLVVRIQFLAIEIARNREGLNYDLYLKLRPVPKLLEEQQQQNDEQVEQQQTHKEQENQNNV